MPDFDFAFVISVLLALIAFPLLAQVFVRAGRQGPIRRALGVTVVGASVCCVVGLVLHGGRWTPAYVLLALIESLIAVTLLLCVPAVLFSVLRRHTQYQIVPVVAAMGGGIGFVILAVWLAFDSGRMP